MPTERKDMPPGTYERTIDISDIPEKIRTHRDFPTERYDVALLENFGGDLIGNCQ